MSQDTMNYEGTLVVETCWCGTRHGVPSELVEHQRRQHREGRQVTGIFCPLGHSWVPSGKSQIEIEREKHAAELERVRKSRDAQSKYAEHLEQSLDAERKSHASTKGQLTKTKKRVAGGVCPCCNRSFVQLARHMASQHPSYTDDAAAGVGCEDTTT